MGRAIVVPPPRWRGAHALALLVAVGLLGYHSPVLYPPVDLDCCRVPRDPAADTVTLINPVREKGVQVALGVAALLPHRRFLLVETWPVLLPPDSPPEARAQAVERLLTDSRAYEEAELAGARVTAARSASRALAGRS